MKKPDEHRAACRDSLASDPRVEFSKIQMRLLVDESLETCSRRHCIAHAAAATSTHVHIVASWKVDMSELDVQEGLKSGLGFCLSRAVGTKGNRWFSRGGVPERVEDHSHLHHLLNDYLPKHAQGECGVFRNFDITRVEA